MHLEFKKLCGIGNDFVMIDNMDGSLELSPSQVEKICDRHFGVGADGVILVEPPRSEGCDAFMNYINSDGTLAQMCGNGVRCFAKFLVDENIVDSKRGELVAETLAGPKPITYEIEGEKLTTAKVNMGEPILDPSLVPVNIKANAKSPAGEPFVKDAPIKSPWGTFNFTCVSMGNPHAICFIEDWDALPEELFLGEEKSLGSLNIDLIGPFFESNDVFPEKSNIEFAQVNDRAGIKPGKQNSEKADVEAFGKASGNARAGSISMRVYERGCGETLACGTGACATSVAATLTERSGRENDIELLGGTLHINWKDDGCVIMEGSAQELFVGAIDVD